MKTRYLGIIAGTVVILLLGVFLRTGSQENPQPAPRVPAGGAPHLAFSFPRGQMRTYSLSWKRSDQTVLPLAGKENTDASFVAKLVGEMTLSSLGQVDDVTVIALSFPRFTESHVELLGERLVENVATAREQLSGQMAYLEVDARGRSRAIRFDDGATDLFRHLATSIAAELDLELPAGLSRWSGTGPGSFGTAEVAFAWEDGRLYRQRVSYPGAEAKSLSSRGEIAVDAAGVLQSLSAFEQADFAAGKTPARSGHIETELRFLRSETVHLDAQAQTVLDATVPQGLGEVRSGGAADKKLLAERIAGLTSEQLLGDLGDFSTLGTLPDESRWLWRATGLLRQDPALAAEIPKMFDQPGFSPRARGFALDLLVLSDTPEAQAAVKTVLERSDVQADEYVYTDALQRLAAVKTPSADSVATVQAVYGKEGRRGVAATYTLGALAHSLAASGQSEASKQLVATLSAGLDGARTDEARISHLGALGNAGAEGEVAHIAAHKSDNSPLVRAAVARALRKTSNEVARTTLHDLTVDADGHVQRAALGTLGEFELAAADLEKLETGVRSGKLVRDNDGLLLSVVQGHADSLAGQAILTEIIERNGDDADLRARARRMLQTSSKTN